MAYTPCFENPDLWLSQRPGNIERAKAGCATCPIIKQCLADCLAYEALSGEIKRGVHGGTSEVERINLLMA